MILLLQLLMEGCDMRTIFKKNEKVKVIETGYMPNTYIHHPGGNAKIKKLIPEQEWLEPLVPLYNVLIENEEFVIPQYSIEKLWGYKNGKFKYL